MDAALHQEIALRDMGPEDEALVCDILAEAFDDDPIMRWMFGGSKPIRTLFRLLAKDIYGPHGFGHMAGDVAATLWLPPNAKVRLSTMSELRLLGSILPQGGLSAVQRAKETGHITLTNHPIELHYYLFAVGVRKEAQGRGLGGRLIREGLKRADAEGAAAYLENSRPRNTPLYERLGFQSGALLPLSEGAPPLLAMLRPPVKDAT